MPQPTGPPPSFGDAFTDMINLIIEMGQYAAFIVEKTKFSHTLAVVVISLTKEKNIEEAMIQLKEIRKLEAEVEAGKRTIAGLWEAEHTLHDVRHNFKKAQAIAVDSAPKLVDVKSTLALPINECEVYWEFLDKQTQPSQKAIIDFMVIRTAKIKDTWAKMLDLVENLPLDEQTGQDIHDSLLDRAG